MNVLFKLLIDNGEAGTYDFAFIGKSKYNYMYSIKGAVSLFWPRGPEMALTSLRNELIVKLQNSQMGASYGRIGENVWAILKSNNGHVFNE